MDVVKQAVPSFVRAAKLMITEGQFDDAFNQVNTAVSPLRGMKLKGVNLGGCTDVHDISPLENAPLAYIVLPPDEILQIGAARGDGNGSSSRHAPSRRFRSTPACYCRERMRKPAAAKNHARPWV